MNTQKTLAYLAGAALATEIIIKHGEGSPHIPHEEHSIHNSGMMGVNAYNIANMQTPSGPTMQISATLLTK